ncbi:MAG: hypothetical protein GXO79_07720 [Chlorobi bacterium]|nr:hypothetical protein [Chlorobiota bacterium]
MEWLKKIVSKIAEEVHKSKIEDFDKKIAELISDHKVMNKTITDNEQKIQRLEDRVFNAIISSAKMEATIKTVLLLKDKEIEQLKLNSNE